MSGTRAKGIALGAVLQLIVLGLLAASGLQAQRPAIDTLFPRQPVGYVNDFAFVVDDSTAAQINDLIERAHQEALAILVAHRAALDALATALIERETVDDADLADLFKGIDPWQGKSEQEQDAQVPRFEPPVEPALVEPVPVASANRVASEPEKVWRRIGRSLRRVPPETSP